MTKAKQGHSANSGGIATANPDAEPAAVTLPAHGHPKSESLLPLPLYIAFALVLLAGILMAATRHSRTSNSAYATLSECNASALSEKDGLSDAYGVLHFNNKPNDVVKWLSLCEMERDLALEVYRKALNEGNKSAKLLALHSAYFLTARYNIPGKTPSTAEGLTAQDFTAIREILDKEKDADIRRTAQRALSDLTLVENIENKRKVEALPSNTSIESGPNRIETREEKIGKTTYLGVRWSNADLASAWLTQFEKSAAWNDQLQRYVVKVP